MKTENNPIEVNPLRFGGFCTTLTLWVTLGFNEYKCFCENKKPDWDTIFKGKEIKYLVSLFWIIIRNNPFGYFKI
jgi:hypothetical protein